MNLRRKLQSSNSSLGLKLEPPKKLKLKDLVSSLIAFKKRNGGYRVQPLDLILFKGDDPVGKLIQKIEDKWVEHNDRKRESALWTHVGIIVDKSILPLDCMEDGKLYVYESIFSGSILGYEYSPTPPVDHPFINGKKCHSGPQIRGFIELVNETQGEIAIAAVTLEQRKRIYGQGIPVLQEKMLTIFHKYKIYGYPFSVFPQLAAASDGFYDFFTKAKIATKR
jgi:hypothetical protein